MTVNDVGFVGKFLWILSQTIFESDLFLDESHEPRKKLLCDLLNRQTETYLQNHPEISAQDAEAILELKDLFVELLSDEEMRDRWG